MQTTEHLVRPTRGYARAARRLSGGAAIVAILLGVWSTAASAHVTVNPKEAAQGGFTKITFRVPNERPDASTTKLVVQLPQDHPIAFVSVKPVPGWSPAEVKKRTLTTPIKTDDGDVTEAVDTITWTGGQIKPGEFQEFDVSLGPLPTDTTQLLFPAIQAYDNGDEVPWIDKPTTGGAEPEHPAPALTLTSESTETHTTAAAPTTTAKPESTTSGGTTSSNNTVAWVGVVLGALGLAAAGAAFVRASASSS